MYSTPLGRAMVGLSPDELFVIVSIYWAGITETEPAGLLHQVRVGVGTCCSALGRA